MIVLRPISLAAVLVACLPVDRVAEAFSDTGRHVIAVLAFNSLEPDGREEVIRILRANPRFEEDFMPPASIESDPAAVARWQIGVAGEWPDVIRSVPSLRRPTWHDQLGATLAIGEGDTPADPGTLPDDATLESQGLHVIQAIELCRKVYGDASRSDEHRAIALCWLCHLVADLHQPCHAGSLSFEKAFPEGDRRGTNIRVTNGRNLHAVWDRLLGRKARPGDVRRRVAEIGADPALVLAGLQAVDEREDMDPKHWMQESRQAALRYVYTPEVLRAVTANERGLTDRVETLTLSAEYLQNAGRVARYRAAQAASRLARILTEAKQAAGPRRTSLCLAHAHNDYLHARPLFDALENGFASVEADIFLVDGELLVAHEPSELSPDRTLSGLYLDPLREIVEKNGGYVHERGREFQLLIDIKSDAEATYSKLAERLTEYRGMLTEVTEGAVTKRAVSVVISGNRPFALISSQATRFAAIDGRLSDLDSAAAAHLIPLISDRWPSHFRWRGDGDFPEGERTKLWRIVRKAHDAQRRVRFWATPDNEKVWAALRAAGVDFINTDDLSGLAVFLDTSTGDREKDVEVGGPRE